MKRFFAIAAAALLAVTASADEGMWMLPMLQKMNKKDLKDAGCRLSPSEIYSAGHTSLKDAIVHFGGGCTGEIISEEGLIVTNHHCGYSHIQALSTPEHNYLMDGYWAMTRKDEIPCKGLTVTFLQSMTDVTDILAKAEKKAAKKGSAEDVAKALRDKRQELVADAEKANPGCEVSLIPFYNENLTCLVVSKVYRDVRFVGAPPASIGKFGGETDNWMWPRHTGDFSMFRVYAGPKNEPADYSPDNRPLRPKNHLKISLAGMQNRDYAMILGYPGRTQRFQTAAQLEQMIRTNRIRIDARTLRQGIMWDAMCADPDVQLKYASKYASSANGWKKWQGEELAFKKLDIIGREQRKEAAFSNWVAADKKRTEAYGNALGQIREAVEASAADENAITLVTEAPYRIELVGLVSRFMAVVNRNGGSEKLDQAVYDQALQAVEGAYRDYVAGLDKKEAKALLEYYRRKADPADSLAGLGGDWATMDIPAYVENLFSNSVFTSYDKLAAAPKAEGETPSSVLENDPAVALFRSVIATATKHYNGIFGSQAGLREGSKAFTAGLLEWEKGQPSYPDANSTMRLTYGHVLPYSPKDAVIYRHFTTLAGVMEKEDPNNPEFIVPARLKQLYETRDFGRYADADGSIHTCFLTNNDITGGNSGSPVLNADGELVGLAFDGNWESMSSDVMFEPDLQRCICVDIRYVLFLVDRFGGASHLIKELDIAK